jgi:hypothetical protein
MLRAVTLSLILLATVAVMMPAGEWLAEASLRGAAAQQSGSRRHSRAWWRRHRALLRRQHALAADRRRRRWTLRTRPVSQASATTRPSLRETLKPVELSDASPSSLASIATIERQINAPLTFTPAPVRQALATPLITVAVPAPVPAIVPMPAIAATVSPASTVTHATTIRSASTPTHAPDATHAAITSTSPTTPTAATPAINTRAQVAPSPVLAHAPQAAAPSVKVAPSAPALTGRDPHKFSALPVPHNWLGVSSTLGGEYKFSLRDAGGHLSGVAVWSHLNLPAQPSMDRRNRSLAGVAHSSLRRTVIDRMVLEGGWVVNDFEREIAGQKVFVVVAQSESNGVRRAWTYYFVDLDGQIFSLATTAPAEFADSVAAEAEQTLSALASRRGATTAPHN